ncbi:hypothetical protein [Pseudarthrobacter raffinosi]|nr:hypothetical protein [Pseudarthrobacter sp. MDT3-9]MCO4253154.1 hypothetical protein [Pseudarthrobacter sp. MDT3-9]
MSRSRSEIPEATLWVDVDANRSGGIPGRPQEG